ncbi:hypothetical protein DMC30DRAFT_61024 [Rhodotorula diobovata]|uniref:Uncharacterized protein n=1 Tax=Rhodotorula diobovata TaxID=5288 RepID=A0A5C5FNE6_9BASI|nr:hypothetical protein DMC30DRAFT_61024 [Rhodotorula diobovata]
MVHCASSLHLWRADWLARARRWGLCSSLSQPLPPPTHPPWASWGGGKRLAGLARLAFCLSLPRCPCNSVLRSHQRLTRHALLARRQLVRHDPREALQLAPEQLVRRRCRLAHVPARRRGRHVDQRRVERQRGQRGQGGRADGRGPGQAARGSGSAQVGRAGTESSPAVPSSSTSARLRHRYPTTLPPLHLSSPRLAATTHTPPSPTKHHTHLAARPQRASHPRRARAASAYSPRDASPRLAGTASSSPSDSGSQGLPFWVQGGLYIVTVSLARRRRRLVAGPPSPPRTLFPSPPAGSFTFSAVVPKGFHSSSSRVSLPPQVPLEIEQRLALASSLPLPLRPRPRPTLFRLARHRPR